MHFWQDSNWWYFMFSAFPAIGSLFLVFGKRLNTTEKTGVWFIFAGFCAQAIWFVASAIGLLPLK